MIQIESLTCPSCHAVISADGETVITPSSRLKTAAEVISEVKDLRKQVLELKTVVEESKKLLPHEPKRKGILGGFFDDD